MDRDMRSMEEKGFLAFLEEVEASALSDNFWSVTLPQNLETSAVNSPAFNVFLAAQIRLNANSFLMNGTKVSDLIAISGDIHHIFPRAYLKKNGVDSKTKYNQVANYIYQSGTFAFFSQSWNSSRVMTSRSHFFFISLACSLQA